MSRALEPGRTLASSPAADPSADTSVPWGAVLVQPERMAGGSRQAVVVDVSGPRVLDGRVRVSIGDASAAGSWEGEPAQHRRVLAPLRPSPGVHRVLVRLEGGAGEEPLLEAGKLVVSAP